MTLDGQHSLKEKIREYYTKKTEELYRAMDKAYGDVAAHYAFTCKGCEDNCCSQRFYHYTLIEYYYLMKGIKTADTGLIKKILARAAEAVSTYDNDGVLGKITPVMCPANFDGLCGLYEYRPMICRLHGLPHEYIGPDMVLKQGSGCLRFGAMHSTTVKLSRTMHYRELALLEKELRAELGFNGRYKKTTAELLLDISKELE